MSDPLSDYEDAANVLDNELTRGQFIDNQRRVMAAYRELREAADELHVHAGELSGRVEELTEAVDTRGAKAERALQDVADVIQDALADALRKVGR
ncbi:hypothetical protein K8O93_00810 [Gordonia bronchialis]|uniref:hypothetical protein n=1 Tax=Gordonia bronchialis TaxID=2054 RepID=UPI001CC16499|nr:hypothetical protein [Gordonia bronchialis]UAK38373.1 hypothetical protein K8O93_00810 [Gordonia bronchialis]